NRGGICIPDVMSVVGANNVEPFCNHVAGAVLIPHDLLMSETIVSGTSGPLQDEVLAQHVQNAASRFKVSRYVVLRRLSISALIPQKQFRRVMETWQQEDASIPRRRRAGGVSPAVKALSQLGRPFVSLVLDAHGRGLLSTSDAS